MINLTDKNPAGFAGDMIAYLVSQPQQGAPLCGNDAVQPMVDRAFAAGDFSGKAGQILMYYPEPAGSIAAKRVLIVGLGRQKSTAEAAGADQGLTGETFRKAGGTVAATALKTRAARILVQMPLELPFDTEQMAQCLTEGLVLGAYQFRKYKGRGGEEEEEPGRIEQILLYAAGRAAAGRGLKLGKTVALAVWTARDMANEPGNKWVAANFADYGLELAAEYGMSCKVLDKADMKRLGLEGILAVNSGSASPPKMVVLEYRHDSRAPTLLLVGKGLTFDSGGLSLKPPKSMEEMKYDMCGGAAILAVMQVLGQERPKGLNVVAIVPATDNLPGPAALKPGDIITMYSGKTVEVVNTDAEGRLILADALAYGIKKFKPAAVIDVATLTGAAVVALGHHRTGLLTNREDLAARLLAAGDRCGEPLWQLPLGPEYAGQIKSAVADIKNVGDRTAGTITAAEFLRHFVGETPWAHLDIAGTAYDFTEKSYIPKGPSGTAVRTIVDLIRHWYDK